MKVKIKNLTLEKFCTYRNKKVPRSYKTNRFFRRLLKFVSSFDLKDVNFECKYDAKYNNLKEPSIIIMNHCSFIDLEIASTIFYPKPINIVATTDAYIGKNWLMKKIGCIPTKKYQVDVNLVGEILNCIKTLKTSVLIFPEAGYSIDGCNNVIPDSLGKLLKFLKVPVYFVKTSNAFLRQPLYNNLNKHKVNVRADVKTVFTKESLSKLTLTDINETLKTLFTFDYWKEQKEENVLINDTNLIEGINRILYKCPSCLAEHMIVKDGLLVCENCGKKYKLNSNGSISAENANTEFQSISSWTHWEREEVKKELLKETYNTNIDVDVIAMPDTYNLFRLQECNFTLKHNEFGFILFEKNTSFSMKILPLETYTVNVDFFWYQIGDIVSIGNKDCIFHCMPKDQSFPVYKIKLAAEELYKLKKTTFLKKNPAELD